GAEGLHTRRPPERDMRSGGLVRGVGLCDLVIRSCRVSLYWADAFRPHCWVLYVKYEPALLSRMLMYWFVATCRFGFWYSARVTYALAMMASCWLSRAASFAGSSSWDIWS